MTGLELYLKLKEMIEQEIELGQAEVVLPDSDDRDHVVLPLTEVFVEDNDFMEIKEGGTLRAKMQGDPVICLR